MKFLDLFAGIGGFRLGMEQAGHECVGYVEIDKYARKSYEAIHDTEGEWTAHDITTVTDRHIRELGDRGRVEIICGGFPCQSFSVAGKRGGFDDTRGTLFFEIVRIANILKPRYLFLENVKGFLNHDQGITFETIIRALDELGYDAEWQVLNSKNFGVPQNRERVFIVGHLRGQSGRGVFPIKGENGNAISIAGYLSDGYKDVNYVLNPEGLARTLTTMQGGNREPKVIQPVLTPDRQNKRQNGRRFKNNREPMFTLTSQDRHGIMLAGNINPSGKGMNGQVYKSEGISPTLTTNKGEGPKISIKEATNKGYVEAIPGDSINYSVPTSKTRRGRVGKGVANTLDTGCQQGVVTNELRIRKLTPRECWRLQGFPDWAFDCAAEVNSNSQLYKQAGNSVTVNVIYEIARKLEVT
ncbi:DNA cytosine methyltransferase [Aquibacillus rhizosphaerae]|uniref:Cytosine-specific methyltransferase n=1 Tax=Aquibacillus rhizosphaerae TaxID=3051431 RepID=A0ABT7LE36_9BACI|nr:DNA (cytosine-5-)-methyltransferase [Aquibacillus sp. LR5S19]MDL4842811.1 DNA (cytosine-5-)-methyltransferase [Aquibacillus sp. LR5S19]